MLVVQRVFRAKRTNLHEKYDYPYYGEHAVALLEAQARVNLAAALSRLAQ